ncbi:MAG: hypothetical protein KC550_05240, partial [Nanoarchaeota archaeon]|nr:hypothetical protein [Nanoarchaeota archaeon]
MVKKSAKKQTKTGSKMESKVDSKIDSKKEKKPVSKSEKLIKGEKEVSKKIISFEDLLQKDYFKLIVSIVFVLFVVSIAFQVRSGPINLDGLDNVVESNTYSQIRQLIVQDLSQKNPNLNDFYLQEAVDKEYQKVLDTGVYNFNGEVINVDEMVKINSANLKEAFKADNGQTYLNAIDPYHFLGLSWNYYLNEHTGTFLVENEMGVETPWVDYKLAPVGIPGTYNPEFHIWLESKLYSLNGLDENSSVGEKTKAVYLIPVIFAMLAGLVTFLILRLLTNDLFALFGSLLFVSVGTFVSRTVAGFVDTDAYNVFFPLIIVLFLIYSFINKNVPKSLTFGIISGFFLGMFTWAWGSGWFIFVFIVFSLFIYLLYVLAVNLYIYFTSIKKKKKVFFELIKNDFLTMISF